MSWKKIKLSEFLKNRNGRYKPNDIAISDFKRIDKIDFSGNIFISDKASNTDMILVKKGDLVISGINIEKGAMTVYEGDNDITATIHYSSYIYDKEKIDIEFLKYFLKSSEFKQAIKEQVPGGIKTEIKPKHLLPLEVFIPTTIKEQKIVVENIKSIEKENLRLATEINTQLDLVKQLRQSFLREAMQGKLVAQNPADGNAKDLLEKIKAEKAKSGKKEKTLPPIKEEEIPFDIPENWVWCRLNDICSDIIDCPHSTPKYLDIETGFYGIDTNCINDRREIVMLRPLSEEGYQERIKRIVPRLNDIIYAREGSIGLAVILKDDTKICLGQRVMLFRPSNELFTLFLLNVVTDENYKGRLLAKHRGMGAKHVNVGDIIESVVPLPPFSEQKRIVEKLDELMRMCDELEQSIKASQQQNEMLLQQVLREALEATPNP